jgi:hypothetical protein
VPFCEIIQQTFPFTRHLNKYVAHETVGGYVVGWIFVAQVSLILFECERAIYWMKFYKKFSINELQNKVFWLRKTRENTSHNLLNTFMLFSDTNQMQINIKNLYSLCVTPNMNFSNNERGWKAIIVSSFSRHQLFIEEVFFFSFPQRWKF